VAEDGCRAGHRAVDAAAPYLFPVRQRHGLDVAIAGRDDKTIAGNAQSAADGMPVAAGIHGVEFAGPDPAAAIRIERGHDLVGVDDVDAAVLYDRRRDD